MPSEVGDLIHKAALSPGCGSRQLRQAIIRKPEGQLDLRYEREGVC